MLDCQERRAERSGAAVKRPEHDPIELCHIDRIMLNFNSLEYRTLINRKCLIRRYSERNKAAQPSRPQGRVCARRPVRQAAQPYDAIRFSPLSCRIGGAERDADHGYRE